MITAVPAPVTPVAYLQVGLMGGMGGKRSGVLGTTTVVSHVGLTIASSPGSRIPSPFSVLPLVGSTDNAHGMSLQQPVDQIAIVRVANEIHLLAFRFESIFMC